MSIYTYVVDHGNRNPSVGIDTEVNGDRCITVAFDDYVKKADDLREFLEKLRDETEDDMTKYSIDDFLN